MKKIPYKPTFLALKDLKPLAIKVEREKNDGYDWDGLRESIIEKGLLEPLQAEELDGIYYLINGGHRSIILKKLYSKEHLVPVIILNRSEKFRPGLDE
jgi:ParB-like chromosome segregation protein Spo0J